MKIFVPISVLHRNFYSFVGRSWYREGRGQNAMCITA